MRIDNFLCTTTHSLLIISAGTTCAILHIRWKTVIKINPPIITSIPIQKTGFHNDIFSSKLVSIKFKMTRVTGNAIKKATPAIFK